MKKYKRHILIVLLILMLCHCHSISRYRFANPLEKVVKIELLHNPNYQSPECAKFEFTLMKELEPDQFAPFMLEIYELETARCVSPPGWGYGWYIVRVTYSNGDVEILGSRNIECIRYGERQTGTGGYYFTDKGLEILLERYVDLPKHPPH